MADSPTLRRFAAALPWVLIAGLVFVTWCPPHLRPHFGSANMERFAAFFVTAAAFVFGFPRRGGWIALGVVLVAAILEVGQLFIPGRDAHLRDALVKCVGGLSGVAAATIAQHIRRIGTGWRSARSNGGR
jgi:hypothetical protein